MDLIPVTKDGEYIEVNPVALAETLALGWVQCEKQADASPKRMTVAEVREALTEKGIPFDLNGRKADLVALLDSAVEAPAVDA